MTRIESEPIDRDERLGEAIEAFLELAEGGNAPEPEEFIGRYPDLADDLREAFEGLSFLQGLVGDPRGPGRILEAGRRVAGYRIVRELGRGGMGVVYEAVHVDLDRPVALKVLGTHAAPDSTGRRRFLNEAKTAAGLHHTHIVPVFDVGQVGGLCYYAMQRIEGCGLDRVLRVMRRDRSTAAGSSSHRSAPQVVAEDDALSSLGGASLSWTGSGTGTAARRPRLRPRDDEFPTFEPPRGSSYYRWVAQVGRQAAEALTYAHRRGVVHRDVKPSNLLVDARGVVWVADFGLARRLADPGITQTDSLLGTPRYMSPEQARGGTLDGRTDVYSLGATLYEMFTLRPPFEGRTAAELVHQITGREPPPPRRFDAKAPRDLETIILKAMAKRPADRYAGAAELAEDLRRFLDTEPVHARRIGPVGRTWRFARRHPALSAVTAVAATVILAVASWAHLSVVAERNAAIQAQQETKQALRETERAVLGQKAARSETLYLYAGAIHNSATTDRRQKGLKVLAEAATLSTDPELRLKLRDEAVEFLGLRDVVPRTPLPTGPTWGLAFTPEVGPLATLSEDGNELTLWDGLGDQPPRRIALAEVEEDEVDAEAQRPRRGSGGWRNGPGVAAVGRLLAVVLPESRGVRLIVPATGAVVADLEMPGRQVEAVLGSPEGSRLITLERVEDRRAFQNPPRYRAVLWDPLHPEAPLATLAEPEPGGQHRQSLRAAFSPDGRTVATSLYTWTGDPEAGSTIRLHDAETGQELARKEDIIGAISALAVGPDGLVAAALSDGSVRFWNGEELNSLTGFLHNQSWVVGLEFSPDGTMLALAGGGPGGGIELWDPATNTLMARVHTPERVTGLAFSLDGKTLAAASGNATSLWALLEPVGRTRLTDVDFPLSLAFGPDGQLAMTRAIGDNAFSAPRIWHPDRCATSSLTLEGIDAQAVAFDAEGHLLAANLDSLTLFDLTESAEPLDRISLRRFARSRDRDRDPDRDRGPHRGWRLLPMTRGGPGQVIALTRFSNGLSEVFLWPADGSDTLRRVSPPPATAGPRGWAAPAVTPDGRTLYLVDNFHDAELVAWTLDDDTQARPLPWSGAIKGVTHLALTRDGRTLAVRHLDGLVRLLDARTGTQLAAIPAPPDDTGPFGPLAPSLLTFAPDGQTLAIGRARGPIELYSVADPRHPRLVLHLPGHRGPVGALAFDHGGLRLASSGDDRVVQVWDLATVRERLAALTLDW